MADAQIKITADTSQAERALGRLNNTLSGLATVASVVAFSKFADSLTNMQNKLNQVTVSGQSANDLFNVMAKTSLELGSNLSDTTELFYKMSINTKDLGLTQSETLRTTNLLIKGFQLSGMSMAEASSATVQLGQAFGQGYLRGDELNTVMERLPMVAEALSVKFNVQRGALKALAEQGKITSKDLNDAINQSGATLEQAWGQRIPTISENFQRLSTVVGVVSTRLDEQTGASRILSYALLIVAEAVIDVSEWFSKWGKWILYVAEAFVILYAPIRLARLAFAALIGPIEWIIGVFRGGVSVLGEIGTLFVKLGEYIAPITQPVTALGSSIARFFGGVAAGVSAGFLGKLIASFNELFGEDKRTAAEKMNQKIADLNKRLGLDAVKAAEDAAAANKRRTAQQVLDEEAIRKATQARDIDLRKIVQSQEDSLALTKFIGDAESIESTILQTNRSLIKEIMNDKNQIIGYTKGLNAEEERTLRLRLSQLEIAKQNQALRALTAPESTSQVTGRATSLFGNTQQGLTVEAERQQTALKLLLDKGIIDYQTYIDQKLLMDMDYADKRIALEQKVFEQQKLLQIQQATGSQFGLDTQKAMAKEATDFQKKSDTEKYAFALDQASQMYTQLGTYNKQAFEAAKAFNIANAIMNTYMAATKALATYPWPFNLVAVGASIALGMAQVAQIRSQTYSGRALGGPVMGNNPYIVGERGPELFTPATSGSITRNDQLGSNPVNVNFTIVANDAAGFDDLLVQRRGMITQMVSDAMAERGQRGL